MFRSYDLYIFSIYKIDGEGYNCGNVDNSMNVFEEVKRDKGITAKKGYIRFDGDYRVYDVNGRLIKEGKGGDVKLPRGVYFYVSGKDRGKVVVW